VIWCYSEKTAVPSLKVLPKRDVINEDVPTDFANARGRPCLVILHDLLNDVYSKQVCDLFTKGSHHRNICVILITQNLFHQGRFCRDISVNAKYLVLLKNVRDKNHFIFLARHIYPESSASLYKAYLDATQRSHGDLFVDLSQDTDDRLRFRTDIFPTGQTIVYTPISDEASEIELYALHVLKTAEPKLRKAIICNCKKDLLNSISECILNILNGNVNLTGCNTRKLRNTRPHFAKWPTGEFVYLPRRRS